MTKTDSHTPNALLRNEYGTKCAYAIATFFGAGRIKPGPGTWGSIAALLLWAACNALLHPAPRTMLFILLAGIALSLVAGIPAATIAARHAGVEDPQFVVIDEVTGQWIALLGCPFDLKHALACLALFRLFDMTKPPPARQLESLPDGWGIVMDDVAAGLYAWGIAALLRHWF